VRGSLALAACVLTVAAGAAAAAAGPVAETVGYIASRQHADGGFAEAGRQPDAQLTAWAALGLAAADAPPEARARALAFLRSHEAEAQTPTALALHVLARRSLGDESADGLVGRLRDVQPGPQLNAVSWTLIALRSVGERAPPTLVRALLAAQTRSGGWSWTTGGAPDSNDTAAAVQALRAAGVAGRPVDRALAFLRTFQGRDGGFALTRGRPADAQSTAWAIQAFLAAGRTPGRAAFRFLAGLRRPDGSYRYSRAYATTPVWVTAQVLPALAGKPFPFASSAQGRSG
jgi:hypothetical protein